ncbi:hypothetical protein CBL_10620 [Carabus blaptoides fortunei]
MSPDFLNPTSRDVAARSVLHCCSWRLNTKLRVTEEGDFDGDDQMLLIVGDTESSVPVKWTGDDIFLLINFYNLHENKFSSSQYNCANVWNVVSADFAKHGIIRDGKKRAEKWRHLKKTYENIRKHNSQTGMATASSSGRTMVRSDSHIASPTSETIPRKNCDTPDPDPPKSRPNKRKR